jgi:transposase-like protein
MTKLSTISKHRLGITCGLCKHHMMLKVSNLIAVVGGDTTAHEVRQRARCHNCGVTGNNTYQIVYKSSSGVAMDEAGIR